MSTQSPIPAAWPPDDGKFRARLAGWIIGLSVVGIVLVSIAVIWAASGDDRAEMSRLVFGSVLPLLGTWVGTVLAFYFARENFAAATESTLRITGKVTTTTPVKDAMIPRASMVVKTLSANQTAGDVTLSGLIAMMNTSGYKRVPILKQDDVALYVVHESLLLSYAQNLGVSANDPVFLAKTLEDLRGVDELKELSEAIAFVSDKATLGDARARMQAVSGCNDVFVTTSGQASETLLGWLTNSLLATLQ